MKHGYRQIRPLVDGWQAKKWNGVENFHKFTPQFVHIHRRTNYASIDSFRELNLLQFTAKL